MTTYFRIREDKRHELTTRCAEFIKDLGFMHKEAMAQPMMFFYQKAIMAATRKKLNSITKLIEFANFGEDVWVRDLIKIKQALDLDEGFGFDIFAYFEAIDKE